MEDVFRMYAMSDGKPDTEPLGLDSDHEEDFEEDDEVETSSVLTSSDDDEGVVEEAIVVVSQVPAPKPAIKRAAKAAPPKKAATKAPTKKAAAKKAAAKNPPIEKMQVNTMTSRILILPDGSGLFGLLTLSTSMSK